MSLLLFKRCLSWIRSLARIRCPSLSYPASLFSFAQLRLGGPNHDSFGYCTSSGFKKNSGRCEKRGFPDPSPPRPPLRVEATSTLHKPTRVLRLPRAPYYPFRKCSAAAVLIVPTLSPCILRAGDVRSACLPACMPGGSPARSRTNSPPTYRGSSPTRTGGRTWGLCRSWRPERGGARENRDGGGGR